MYTSMRNPWATLDWPPITLAMRRRHLGEALAGESLTYQYHDDDDYKRHFQQNDITCDEEEKDGDNDI